MIRITVVYTGLQGMPAVSSYYFEGTGQTAADEAAAAVNDFCALLEDPISTLVTFDVDNIATEINPATGEIVAYYTVVGETYVGTRAADALPIGTSVVMGFKTSEVVRGRRVQGRTYLPGFTEYSVPANGVLEEGTLSALSGFGSSTLGAGPRQHVVWSRPIEGGDPGLAAPVAAYDVSAVMSNLRSRRR